ncbi:hypothetical protein [Aliterella atlantica]|nr:hypothetical protein [Aliterella atlantica]
MLITSLTLAEKFASGIRANSTLTQKAKVQAERFAHWNRSYLGKTVSDR